MKNIIKNLSLLTLMLSLSAVSYAEDETMTVTTKRLKMETALRIAQAAIKQCLKVGVLIAVTVVDRAGHAQVVLRDVLAMDITLPISKQKAHTAMAFNAALSTMEDRFTKPFQVPKIKGLVMSAGGIPINIGGSILGGIGVSGAPSGEIDEKCANAGLDAVREDLEME